MSICPTCKKDCCELVPYVQKGGGGALAARDADHPAHDAAAADAPAARLRGARRGGDQGEPLV